MVGTVLRGRREELVGFTLLMEREDFQTTTSAVLATDCRSLRNIITQGRTEGQEKSEGLENWKVCAHPRRGPAEGFCRRACSNLRWITHMFNFKFWLGVLASVVGWEGHMFPLLMLGDWWCGVCNMVSHGCTYKDQFKGVTPFQLV